MPPEERSHAPLLSKKDALHSYSKRDLKNSQIKNVTDELNRNLKSDKSLRYKIDLSENNISDDGVEKLVDWLSNTKWGNFCVELRLHKNQIGDAGATSLARFLSHPKNKLEALHLSHNKIGTNGVMKILYSLADSKSGGKFTYPRTDENGDSIIPLWLRLERNDTPNLEDKLVEWRRHVLKARELNDSYQPICSIAKRCRPHRCERGKKGIPPLCHLNITSSQSKSPFDKLPMSSTQPISLPQDKAEPAIIEDGNTESFTSPDLSDNDVSPPLLSDSPDLPPSTSERNEPPTDENDNTVGENLPFYILMDISAVLDILELRNNDMIYLFSLPGLLALCNSGLMKYVDGEASQTKASKSDDSERIVLIFVRNIFNELNKISFKHQFVMKKFEEARDTCITPLMNKTVIELLEGCDELNYNLLDPTALQKAREYGLSEETISTIQFALVWGHNLSKVSESSKSETKRPVNCIFLTCNPSVTDFFDYLKQEYTNDNESPFKPSQLPCITTEQLNHLLNSHFPTLKEAVLQPNVFRNQNTQQLPTTSSKPVLKASTLIPLIDEYLHSLPNYTSYIASASTRSSSQTVPQPLYTSTPVIAHRSDSISSEPISTIATTTSLPLITSSSSISSISNSNLPLLDVPTLPPNHYFYPNYPQSPNNVFENPNFSSHHSTILNSLGHPTHLPPIPHLPPSSVALSAPHAQFNSIKLGSNILDPTWTTPASTPNTAAPPQNLQLSHTRPSEPSPTPSYPSFSIENTPQTTTRAFTSLSHMHMQPVQSIIYPTLNESSVSSSINPNSSTTREQHTVQFTHKPSVDLHSTFPQKPPNNPVDPYFDGSGLIMNHLNVQDSNANLLKSELIGAIAIVEELSNRLKFMANHKPVYSDDCLHRAKSHITRWSQILSNSTTDFNSNQHCPSNENT